MSSNQSPAVKGTLHHFAPGLVAFEYQLTRTNQPSTPPRNALLFLDGLYGSLLNVTYARLLSTRVPASWAVIEVILPSSGPTGWCTGSLTKDAASLAKAVAYFRNTPQFHDGKIVLMGHSTGCQTATEYVLGPWKAPQIPQQTLARPRVDGVVLQAGVSDAEALREENGAAKIHAITAVAREWVAHGRGEDVLPRATMGGGVFGGEVPCARRWVSLASVDGEGEDDYFSSDASDEKVGRVWGRGGFGGRGVPVLPLLGGEDEAMPGFVDKEALVKRWTRAVKEAGGEVGAGSGVVPGASHNLNKSSEEVRADLCRRVVEFLQGIERGKGS